ncbi:hypothetical protein ABIE65_005610, partial [Constrictibacter sp. MBR-5]
GALSFRQSERHTESQPTLTTQHVFGSALSADQYSRALEDVEIAQGVLDAAHEKAEAIVRGKPDGEARNRTRNRGGLPAHLPRVERKHPVKAAG